MQKETEQYWAYFVCSVSPSCVSYESLPNLDKLHSIILLHSFPVHFAAIQINHDLYITGGTNLSSQDTLGKVVKYSLNPLTNLIKTTDQKSMHYNRLKHCLVNVGDKYLYAIGGYGDAGKLRVCEKFSIEKDHWKIVPSLNHARLSAISCVVQHYIYLIGGYTGKHGPNPKQYERLDICDEESGWTIQEITSGEDYVDSILGSGSFAISPFDILIFGGTSKAGPITGIRFNTTENVIEPLRTRQTEQLKRKYYLPYDDKFRNIAPFQFRKKIYVIGDCVGKKCCWSLKKKCWSWFD